MKILLTCDPEIPVPPTLYGGIERIVAMLIDYYLEQGNDITLCANGKSAVPCKLIPWKGKRSRHFGDTIKNMTMLSSVVIKQKFDVVHSFSRLAYMTAIMPLKIPKIMSYQREPSLQQINKAVKISRKGSMFFTGCSNYITDQIKPVANAATIYNGVFMDKYECKETISDDAPLIFLGRIEEIKGTHIAIEVAVKSNKKLIIAGNIPDSKINYFEKEIKPHLNGKITYVGPVDDKKKNELLGKSLALIMPIQWNEPFGIVMVEAMACGTPVIGFAKGSVGEIIDNGANGFICNDVDSMVDAVNNITSINRVKVRQMAEQRFSSKKIATDYLNLYSSLIN